MSDDQNDEQTKSIGERAEEIWQGVIDVLDSLVNPEPELIPIPIKGRRPYPPRRR